MSRSQELTFAIASLYEVVEVNNIGGIPAQVATEALRLVNPALAAEHAAALVAEADTRGRQQLSRDDFINAVSMSLQNTEVLDAIRVTNDLVNRMRTTYRRRYLMYDAPANTPAPALLDNAKLVSTFRELFDLAGEGKDYISRSELRSLVQDILPEFPSDASNIVKAALGEGDSDAIGFYEFIMTMQPATSRRPLSEMVRLAKLKRDNSVGKRQSNVAGPLRSELESYKQLNATMEERFKAIMTNPAISANYQLPVAHKPLPLNATTEADREIAALKIKNDELTHQVALLRVGNAHQISPIRDGRNQSTHMGRPTTSNTTSDPFTLYTTRISELEKDLRLCRAQLHIAQESNQLANAIRTASATAVSSVLKEHYPDESALVSKHDYLREASSVLQDAPPHVTTIVTQYDLVVASYQALYRALRAKVDATKKKPFDVAAAARQIIPAMQVAVPSGGGQRRASSPVVAVSPLRWKHMDRPEDPEMRNTGALSDPLLTREERNVLRAKLATQMRGAARHYQSPTASQRRSVSGMSQPDEIVPAMTSKESMRRLQQLSGRAHRDQRLY